MNNIHILPTDKPSRLHNKNGELGNYPSTKLYIEDFKGNQHNSFHIYITNDEKIKEGDYVIWNGKVYKDSKRSFTGVDYSQCKKIILTTDQDLIKDGVQAIDDEFLEWFVENPSCEYIEVVYGLFTPMGRQVNPMHVAQNHSSCVWKYKIIIPKEEPNYNMKQEILDEMKRIEEPKQETLEEAIDRIAKEDGYDIDGGKVADFVDGMVKGAKWQQERMYSEEEVIQIQKEWRNFDDSQDSFNGQDDLTFKEWFEQFKKK